MLPNLFSYITVIKALSLLKDIPSLKLCLHMRQVEKETIKKPYEGEFLRAYYRVDTISLGFKSNPQPLDLATELKIQEVCASPELGSVVSSLNFYMPPKDGAIFSEVRLSSNTVLTKTIYLNLSEVKSLFCFWMGIDEKEANRIIKLVREKISLEEDVPEVSPSNNLHSNLETKKKI